MKKRGLIKTTLDASKMSCRDAIKFMAISPVVTGVLASTGGSSIADASEDVSGKIVIVSGGAGAIMALSRLSRAIKNLDITIIAPNKVHLYRPGQVFVAAGEMKMQDLILDNNNYINQDEVTWIKDEVATFDPDNNSLTTRTGKEMKYDYMVVAAGIQYHYEAIKGLIKEDIDKNGITSVYLNMKSIDVKAKKATFVHAYEKEVYDEDFDTTEMVGFADTVVLDYDFIHIVPPMSPVNAVVNSKLVGKSGWLEHVKTNVSVPYAYR